MRILFTLLIITLIACADSEDCNPNSPAPDTSLGWMPFQNGNYWRYNCGSNCSDGDITYQGWSMWNVPWSEFQEIDSLTIFKLSYSSWTAQDKEIWAMSKDGQKLYTAYDSPFSQAFFDGGTSMALDELVLTYDFSLIAGQIPSVGYKVKRRSENIITFSDKSIFQKGLGFRQKRGLPFDEVEINGVIYKTKCW